MLVLSSPDTDNLNGYIGWCGCHEILTQRCITVLLLIRFCRLSSINYEFSLFSAISVQSLNVLVDCLIKIQELPKKMSISSSEFQRQIILSQKTDRIHVSVLNA